ncbi:MAG: hypothetical protein QGH15_23020, partial [Kiritimatiellia bacterium]|nr:hypothetical protein [Kiritimatiellia bacterium]
FGFRGTFGVILSLVTGSHNHPATSGFWPAAESPSSLSLPLTPVGQPNSRAVLNSSLENRGGSACHGVVPMRLRDRDEDGTRGRAKGEQ